LTQNAAKTLPNTNVIDIFKNILFTKRLDQFVVNTTCGNKSVHPSIANKNLGHTSLISADYYILDYDLSIGKKQQFPNSI